MWLFLPLLITGQALSYPAPTLLDQVQNINTIRGINENFLNKLSMEAAWAYGQIIGNTSQSLNSIRTALTDWSKRYGIQKEYQQFADEIEKENENFKKSVKDLMPKLTKYFADYMKVVDDKKQSVASAFNRTADLAKQLDDKQKAIAEYIMRVYLPSLADVPGINSNSGGGFPGSNSGFPDNRGVIPSGNTGYPWGNGGGPGGFAGGNSGIPGSTGLFDDNIVDSSWGNDFYPKKNNGYPGGNVGFSGTSGILPGSNEGSSGNSGIFSGSRPGFPANSIGVLGINGPFSSSTGDLQRGNNGFQGGRGGLFGGNDILLKNDGSFPRTYGPFSSNGGFSGRSNTQQLDFNRGIPGAQVGDHDSNRAFGAQSGLNPKKPLFGQANSFRQ
ncbi:hypothetical protein V3C99_008285 [Haemonchus contortus]|uniref:ANIS5_cation-bd domain-containing protein n=1 Tax=Haemonchus contortus TaxID=6289 RepID=A0A7I4YNG9_HAECO|nr:Protein of unknown function DUF148 domain containing protein [Haemonchus contortus]